MREQWLLKCCDATLSLRLVSEQTKDTFGEGEDMEMHNGDTGELPLTTALYSVHHSRTAATGNRREENEMKCFFKLPFLKGTRKTTM